MSTSFPHVTILTPVYNGAKYLDECIESIRNQQYRNWKCIIVNNCSTDSSLDIANRYAEIDSRITVHSNLSFVNVVENHNIAFRLIAPESKYCKVVSADDWITPDCINKLVKLAEANPTVGVVASNQLKNNKVHWEGLPKNTEVISGHDVCRLTLMNKLDVFANPTSNLYRCDLIRKEYSFFPSSFHPYADTSACFKYLQYCDFGFVHEILSNGRVHDHQVTAKVRRVNMGDLASLEFTFKYGPIYLTEDEFEICKNEKLKRYFRGLGGCILKMKEKQFWKFHASILKEFGYSIPWSKVIKGAIDEIMEEIKNPKVAFNKLSSVIKQRYHDLLEEK